MAGPFFSTTPYRTLAEGLGGLAAYHAHFIEAPAFLSPREDRPGGSGSKLRGPGERANGQFTSWRILHKFRCCPWKAGQFATRLAGLHDRRMKKARLLPMSKYLLIPEHRRSR
jgi:hypothetical protein